MTQPPKKPRFRVAPRLSSASEIRRANLETLLSEFAQDPQEVGLPEHGRYTRFAERIGTTGKSFSHIRQGRRDIGHAMARRLEEAFGKPRNWLDIAHGSSEKALPPATDMRQMLAVLLEQAASVDAVETGRALLAIVARKSAL
jgi:plasmid maintenance system antidote protein VapI